MKETELTERWLMPQGGLLLGAARAAVGLGCALPVPLPGMEMIRFSDEESLFSESNDWSASEWANSDITDYSTFPIFVAHNQPFYNISAHPAPGVQSIDLSACDADGGSISPIFQHLDSLISNL